MLITLIPLFDENLKVSAYSLFAQKNNYFLQPSLLGTGQNDGAARIAGLELIEAMGIETLSAENVFVSVGNISIFSDVAGQCSAPHNQIILLIDNTIPPVEMYLNRIVELKKDGYRFAIRNLPPSDYEKSAPLLELMDYILIDTQKADIASARMHFSNAHPSLKLIASNIRTMEDFEAIKGSIRCALFEGSFYRLPITKGSTDTAPLKINYIELMNQVNDEDYDLTKAADIISRDTSLVILLLQMVNKMTLRSEITSVRHAAAMLGQKELRRWINTALINELCSDKPSEVTRLSLLRAKFAENLAPSFEAAGKASEAFLMGLFSVLDIILERPLEDAMHMVKVSLEIENALLHHKGPLGEILTFVLQYETANWPEISRQMVLKGISMNTVYEAYVNSLRWYRDLISIK